MTNKCPDLIICIGYCLDGPQPVDNHSVNWSLAVPLETTRCCSVIRNVRSSSPTQQPAFTCKVVLLYV